MDLTLAPEQLAAASKFNHSLGLSQRAARILQYVIQTPINGTLDDGTAQALVKWIVAKNPLVPKLYEAIVAGNAKSAVLPAEWKNVMASLSQLVSTQLLAKAFVGKLGEVSEANVFSIVKYLADNGLHTLAMILAADYYKLPAEEAVAFSYDAALTDTYHTSIAFTDMHITPARDRDRTRDGRLAIAAAPYKELAVRIGKSAFESAEKFKQTLIFAFGIDVRALTPIRPAGALMATERQKALVSNQVRYASKRTMRILQGALGAPKSGKMDDDTINQIAHFQKRQGLPPNGILNDPTLAKLVGMTVTEYKLPEAAAYLVAGFFNMREDHVTALAYNPAPSAPAAAGTSAIQGLYFIEVGQAAFASTVIDFARALAKQMCALVNYKGPAFTGQHSGTFDSAFLPSIQLVNDLAAKNKVQIMISGPNASTFRPEGIVVVGAVVKPAARSNHKIGHAIDFNLIAEGKQYNSGLLNPSNRANWGAPIRNFINDVKAAGLRWGGDFSPTDPIHIDDGQNGRPLEYDQRLLATQSAYNLVIAPGKVATRGLDNLADEPVYLDCDS